MRNTLPPPGWRCISFMAAAAHSSAPPRLVATIAACSSALLAAAGALALADRAALATRMSCQQARGAGRLDVGGLHAVKVQQWARQDTHLSKHAKQQCKQQIVKANQHKLASLPVHCKVRRQPSPGHPTYNAAQLVGGLANQRLHILMLAHIAWHRHDCALRKLLRAGRWQTASSVCV